MPVSDKFRIGDELYYLSPSPDGTLDTNEYVSDDQLNPEEWNEVERIDVSDNNKTIFQKITGMLRNVRFLFTKIGNTDISDIGETITDAVQNLYDFLKTKAYVDHDHRQDYQESLPIADHIPENTEERESTIPYSSVIYKMNRDINEKSDEIFKDKKMPSFTTNINFGGISKGTFIDTNYDTPKEVLKDLLDEGYKDELIDVWETREDVDRFFMRYNAENNWNGLLLGNVIRMKTHYEHPLDRAQVEDETDWIIAGFDCENRDFTANGETYNNGRGLCLTRDVRGSNGENMNWRRLSWISYYADMAGGYKNSLYHSRYFPAFSVGYKALCGDHLILRHVLISDRAESITDSIDKAVSYAWDEAYFTLMSPTQMYANNPPDWEYFNKFDIGEADYRLPIYNPLTYGTTYLPSDNALRLYTRALWHTWAIGGAATCVYGESLIEGRAARENSNAGVMIYMR